MEKKKRSEALGFLEKVIWCFSLRARAHPQPSDLEHRIDHYVAGIVVGFRFPFIEKEK
jgi:hypothetical protein